MCGGFARLAHDGIATRQRRLTVGRTAAVLHRPACGGIGIGFWGSHAAELQELLLKLVTEACAIVLLCDEDCAMILVAALVHLFS